MRDLLRKLETYEEYEKVKADRQQVYDQHCPLCTKDVVQEYTHWKVVPNTYPYDAIAEVHHMLMPKRHVANFSDLTPDEVTEYRDLEYSIEGYDAILRNFLRSQSVPQHFHVHLITYKVID